MSQGKRIEKEHYVQVGVTEDDNMQRQMLAQIISMKEKPPIQHIAKTSKNMISKKLLNHAKAAY